MTATPAQIAAADKARASVVASIAAATAYTRKTVETLDPAKLPVPRDVMLAAADRADALIANADPKLVLGLRDAGQSYNGQLTVQQAHIPYMALVLALAGKPKTDDRSRGINRIVAAL